MLDRHERFVIPLRGDDSSSTGRMSAGAWPSWARCRCAISADRQDEDGKRRLRPALRRRTIRLAGRRSSYTWCCSWVRRGALLCSPTRWTEADSQSLWWIARIYLTRWKIGRLFASSNRLQLEDIRVMKYQRLKNLVVLVTAAYFARPSWAEDETPHPLQKLLIISQRFFGIPPFRSTRWPMNQEHPLPKQPRPRKAASQYTTGNCCLLGRSKSEETPIQQYSLNRGLLMEATGLSESAVAEPNFLPILRTAQAVPDTKS